MVAELDRLKGEESLTNLIRKVSIKSKDDIYGAAMNMNHIAAARGMQVALCENIASGTPMTDANDTDLNAQIFGWEGNDHGWLKDHRIALHSPLPQACRFLSEPFWCNNDGFHGCRASKHLDQFDLSVFFSGKISNYAIMMVPVHLPFGQVSANSFNPIDRTTHDLSSLFERYAELFGLLTRRFITDYVDVTRTETQKIDRCVLSKREVECLMWAAQGKTDNETAEIVSISRSTVRFHVLKAAEKLETANRAQTIFKATQLGYLKIPVH